MAKVKGPLMSMEASGTVGKTVTFATWKGRPYVRQHTTPSNPQSGAQMGVRANFSGLNALWKLNTVQLQSAFETLAKQQGVSAFNAFVGFNQKRLSQAKFAGNTPTPTDEAPSAPTTGGATTVNLKYIQVSWTDSVDPDAWAVYVYRSEGAVPDIVNSNLVAVVPRGVELYNDGPLPAGTYHYKLGAVHIEGGMNLEATDITGVVV